MQQVVYRAECNASTLANPLIQGVVHGLAELMPVTDRTDWPQPLTELLAQLENPQTVAVKASPVVLVVGRCPTMTEQATTLLRASALDVVSCGSGEAATAVLRQRSAEVAMVVADQHLDGMMDGCGLAQAIGLLWPGIPVILASETSGTKPLPEAVTHLEKPWQPLALLVEMHRNLAEPPTLIN